MNGRGGKSGWKACVGRARGVRVVCVGRVWCVWGVGCVWHVWGVWGRAWGVCVGQKVLVSLAPLYYPDTLVNPDTCLGYDTFITTHTKYSTQNNVFANFSPNHAY